MAAADARAEDRLFCIDVAVESLTILRNHAVPLEQRSFTSISLFAQFLTFAPLTLINDLPGDLLDEFASSQEERKLVRLQSGKSALLKTDRRNLIDQLREGNLVLAVVGDDEGGRRGRTLLLNAQLGLSAAAAYFVENGNGGEDHRGDPLKFTSAGVIDLKDEFDRKRAELQIGYRLWQLGSSMDDFLSLHEQLDQRAAAVTAWLPTFPNEQRRAQPTTDTGGGTVRTITVVTADTQTEAIGPPLVLSDVEIQTEEEVRKTKSSSSSGSSAGNRSRRASASSAHGSVGSENSAKKSSSLSSMSSSSNSRRSKAESKPEPIPMPLLEAPDRQERETAVRRLIAELERLTRDNSDERRVQLRPVDWEREAQNHHQHQHRRSKTIERRLPDEKHNHRQQKAIRTYDPAWMQPGNKSFNLYSRLYLAKANGYGLTKTYLQRLAYFPLYQAPIVPAPSKPPVRITKKVYMKDEATDCDLDQLKKGAKAITSETQTDAPVVSARRARSASSTRRSSTNATGLSVNDIRRLVRALGENAANQQQQQQKVSSAAAPVAARRPSESIEQPPQRPKRLLSIGQRSASSLGQRRQSLIRHPPALSRRTSRMSIRSGAAGGAAHHAKPSGSRSQSLSSIKSEPPSRGPSPFTESVATADDAQTESDTSTSSATYASVPEQLYSSDRSSNASVATAVEQPVVDSSRRQSRATTIASVDEAVSRSRMSSFASSVKFGPSTTSAATITKGTSTPEGVLKKTQYETSAAQQPLSPVSEYLHEFKMREAARQRHQLAQRAMSIRTESVSSYMPSDAEHFPMSSTSSPLQRSGARP